MKTIQEMLGAESHRSNDTSMSYGEKMAMRKNEEIGNLNEKDGIDCPDCKNKGVIYACEPCEIVLIQKECKCMQKRKSVLYAKESGLEGLLNFRVSTYQVNHDWQQVVKNMAIDYVRENQGDWFCMLGQSGAGKTHICSAIARTFIEKTIETKYVVWTTFIRELKKDMLETQNMLYQFMKVPVLYIDDFLKGKYTDTDITLAFDLINYRYNNRLITIVSTELLFSELMKIDSAIAGRLKERSGNYFIELQKGNDKNYRITMKVNYE